MIMRTILGLLVLISLFYYGLMLPLGLSLALAFIGVVMGPLYRLINARCRKAPWRDLVFPPRQEVQRCLLRWSLVLGAFLGVKLYWAGLYIPAGLSEADHRADLMARRAYLIAEVADPEFSVSRMPGIFGRPIRQGYGIVCLSMTTAALTNMAFLYPETKAEALGAVRVMLHKILEEQFWSFEVYWWGENPLTTLAGDNGNIGYLGHLNWMLGAFGLLGGGDEFQELHRDITQALARRMEQAVGAYLETYPGRIFVPDNMVMAASVALYDRRYGPHHQGVLAKFVNYSRDQLRHPDYGLLYPYLQPDGRGFGVPRGSFSTWNGIFLPKIDVDLAAEQWAGIRKYFLVRSPFRSLGIREYPPGVRGLGDFDSGPVIFGLSTAGTGFGVAGARWAAELETSDGLLRSAEYVGSSWDSSSGRRYLLGPLLGDAIMLAMRTTTEWDRRY